MDRRGHVTAGKGLGRIASVASAAVMALSLVVGAVVPSPSAAAAAAAETDAAPAPVVSTPAGTVVGPLVAGDQGVNPDEDDQVDAVLDAFAGDDVVHDFVGFYRWSSATYEVHAKRGSVTFQRVWDGNGYTYPIVSVTGENPFANTDPEQPWAPDDATATLSERARPYPYERLSALFGAPDAPDLAVEPHWRNDPSTATHSRMEGHSSRALFVVSGPGFNHEGIVDRHAKQVDLAPTLAALVGAPLVDGRYKGQPATGLRVKWQDGDPLEDVLDGTHPERTLVVTLDQGFTPLVLDMFDKGELPNLRSLVDDGTMYRYGLVANYPSDTLPSNSVLATGAWSGHTGVTGNHIYDRDAGVVWDPVEPEWFAVSDLYTSPEVETLFDLADRTFPGAWTVSADSPIHRGADTASARLLNIGYRAKRATTPIEKLGVLSGLLRDIPVLDPRGFNVPLVDLACDPQNGTVFSNVVDGLATASVAGQFPWTRALSTSPRGELPRFVWYYQTRTDGIGHSSRFADSCLRRAYRDADARLGIVLSELDVAGARDTTAVVVTSDHGRAETDYDTPLSSILDTVPGLDYVQAGFFVYLR